MKIQLSDKFTYKKLFGFTWLSIVMMVFTSIYSVVDGLFVSNTVGKNALAAINIVMPLVMVLGAIGFMLGAGGSAVVAKTMGEGDQKRANKYFSMIIYVIIVIGISLSALCIVFVRPICYMLGASDLLIDDCVTYGRILLLGSTLFMLQTTFQTFFVVANKGHIGLTLTIASGLTNMVLDFVFVYILKWGIFGAAVATVCGYFLGGIIPLFYFFFSKTSCLKLGKTKLYFKVLCNSCFNGSSEMLTNISASVVTCLYNLQMMRLIGEEGVAAITVLMYVNFVFVAIFIGFNMGVAPLISYNYGAKNKAELQNLYKKSLKVVVVVAASMLLLSQSVAVPLVKFFVKSGEDSLVALATRGFRIYALSFAAVGFNIFGSAFFTALNNGKISAAISLLRSLVFPVTLVFLLPLFFNIDGIWLVGVVTEFLTLIATILFLNRNKRVYGYAKSVVKAGACNDNDNISTQSNDIDESTEIFDSDDAYENDDKN